MRATENICISLISYFSHIIYHIFLSVLLEATFVADFCAWKFNVFIVCIDYNILKDRKLVIVNCVGWNGRVRGLFQEAFLALHGGSEEYHETLTW
jgi:hypothetical protein